MTPEPFRLGKNAPFGTSMFKSVHQCTFLCINAPFRTPMPKSVH